MTSSSSPQAPEPERTNEDWQSLVAARDREIARLKTESNAQISQLRREIESSEQRTSLIMTNIPVGFLLTRLDSIMEAGNSIVEDMFGYPRGRLVNQPLSLLFPDLVELEESSNPIQLFGLSADGRRFPAEVRRISVGTPMGDRQFVFVSDITERYELEELKRDFVAMVSHDLSTPLASVRSCLQMIGEGVYGELQPDGLEIVDAVRKNVDRLVALVSDLLDMDKLETGKLELVPSRTTLEDVIGRAIEAILGLCEPKGITLKRQVGDDMVFIDSDRIVQVLVNLLSNAIKFSPNNSTIFVQAWTDNSFLNISVIDQGQGIPDDMKALVFEKYRQVKPDDKNRLKGFGLGLAICRAIVEQHGGTIWVEDGAEKGCAFRIRMKR